VKPAGRETLFSSRYRSPLGDYLLVSSGKGVVLVVAEDQRAARVRCLERAGAVIKEGEGLNAQLAAELDSYFGGRLERFTVLLDIRGTAFQLRVWKELQKIPYGCTRSYGDVARGLGVWDGARAVGQACRANPIAIVVPCHRVVGATGVLTGYAGGLATKAALLALESRVTGAAGGQALFPGAPRTWSGIRGD